MTCLISDFQELRRHNFAIELYLYYITLHWTSKRHFWLVIQRRRMITNRAFCYGGFKCLSLFGTIWKYLNALLKLQTRCETTTEKNILKMYGRGRGSYLGLLLETQIGKSAVASVESSNNVQDDVPEINSSSLQPSESAPSTNSSDLRGIRNVTMYFCVYLLVNCVENAFV